MASYSDRFVAFIDILGFKDLIDRSTTQNSEVTVDSIREQAGLSIERIHGGQQHPKADPYKYVTRGGVRRTDEPIVRRFIRMRMRMNRRLGCFISFSLMYQRQSEYGSPPPLETWGTR
jgi:hypothetical protein